MNDVYDNMIAVSFDDVQDYEYYDAVDDEIDNTFLIKKFLDFLNPNQKTVLEYRFGLDSNPMTYKEIADKMCFSVERARQIELKAISVIRKQIAAEKREKWVK